MNNLPPEPAVFPTRHQLLIETLPEPIVAFNGEGEITLWNAAAERLFGYRKDEVVGSSLFNLIAGETAQDEFRARMKSLTTPADSGNVGGRWETRSKTKSGSLISVEVAISALREADAPWSFIAIGRDITERAETETRIREINVELEQGIREGGLALRESELRWRFALESTGDGIWDWDIPTGTVFFSTAWKEMLGFAEEEIGNGLMEWERRIHPEDKAQTMAAVQAHLDGAMPAYANEHRVSCKDGSWKWILDRGFVLSRDAAGNPLRMIGTHKDISVRKLAEEASREKDRLLIESQQVAHLGSWTIELPGFRVVWSDEAYRVFGVQPDTFPLSFDSFLSLIHPEDVAEVNEWNRACFAGETPGELEFRVTRPAGSVRMLRSRGSLVHDPTGRSVRMVGTIQDVTVRLKGERTTRLHEAALEAAANAIVITDREGIIEWANPAFSLLSGWPLAEAIGKNPREVMKSGEHDAAFYKAMWDTLLAGKIWQGEIINCRKDGTLRTEDMTITPLRDERGEIAHFIAIKQDITQHKLLETQFLQAQRMEAMGSLAGGIAHDLNNILAPIMMVTGLLAEKLTNERDREMLAMMLSNAQRGAGIIKQLLIFSRGQDGERLRMQPRHLINEMVNVMKETFPREIDLQQELPAGLWPIVADPTQFHQVLMNLCVNARDAMPTGGHLSVGAANVTLAAGDFKLPPHAKPGPYVAISVSDTGHGIPPEIRRKIFDPFFTTKPLGKGTGLGLSTVLGIVQHHGGFVDLDSTPHVGSTFKIYLPAFAEGIEAAAVIPPPALVAGATGGATVLVVDDERDVRDAARLLLEGRNYRVITATQGENALTEYLVHRAKINLVLTDLMMPTMSGLILIRALRAIDPALKIVAMSGLSETIDRQELAVLGVPDVLLKPCEGSVLLEAVRLRLARA